MKFSKTGLSDAYLIETDPVIDKRGFFARLWCQELFEEHGIRMEIVQASISHNAVAGTVRGLHYQWPPSAEGKLIRCEKGRVFDVIVDLRPESPTFAEHFSAELDGRKRNALYVPPGFAHGFQTLESNSDVFYMMSDVHQPDLASGVRFDDPAFSISWPLPVQSIADRDRDYDDFDRADYICNYSRRLNLGGGQS